MCRVIGQEVDRFLAHGRKDSAAINLEGYERKTLAERLASLMRVTVAGSSDLASRLGTGLFLFDSRSLRRLRAMFSLPVVTLAVLLLATVASPSPIASKATLFVATNGSDSGSCTNEQPCASLARAYSLARPGAIVEIQAGEYGEQELGASSSRAGGNVVFRPAPGAAVTLEECSSTKRLGSSFATCASTTGTCGIPRMSSSGTSRRVSSLFVCLTMCGSWWVGWAVAGRHLPDDRQLRR